MVECLYHLHPRRLWRLCTTPDPKLRKLLRFSYWHIIMTFWSEIYEFITSHRQKIGVATAQSLEK